MTENKKSLDRVVIVAPDTKIHKDLITYLKMYSVEIQEISDSDEAIYFFMDMAKRPEAYTNSKPNMVFLEEGINNYEKIKEKITQSNICGMSLPVKERTVKEVDYYPKSLLYGLEDNSQNMKLFYTDLMK